MPRSCRRHCNRCSPTLSRRIPSRPQPGLIESTGPDAQTHMCTPCNEHIADNCQGIRKGTLSHSYTVRALVEQVLPTWQEDQDQAMLIGVVRSRPEWVVHCPCSEETWSTRLPTEKACAAPSSTTSLQCHAQIIAHPASVCTVSCTVAPRHTPRPTLLHRCTAAQRPLRHVRAVVDRLGPWYEDGVAAQVAAVRQALHETAGADDVGAAGGLEPCTVGQENLAARAEPQHARELEHVRSVIASLCAPRGRLNGGKWAVCMHMLVVGFLMPPCATHCLRATRRCRGQSHMFTWVLC
jgi:hypothetical protein